MDAAATSYGAITTGYTYDRDRAVHDRDRLEYELTVRQEPKQARMCGVGSDRRPIDPPPIIQLRVIDKRTRQPPAQPDVDDGDPNYAHSFLQNPYYFMFASLAKPDDDAELHWLKDGKTRCTTGSVVSSLYHLKDTENRNEDAGFFVFPDLSVRTEGSYRLKLSLFEVVGNTVRHCRSIYSAPFYVYTAKKFPGMEESTPLSCSLADQGIKIRIRKDIRVRKRPIAALAAPIECDKVDEGHEEDPSNCVVTINGAMGKRARHGTLSHAMNLSPSSQGDISTPTSANSVALAGLPAWPTTALDPMLGVASAPGGIELTSPTHSTPSSAGTGSAIPPGSTYDGPKVTPVTIPPPPGAHIMPPQGSAFDNSGPRPSTASTIAARQLQSLTPTYPSANSQAVSPTGPPVSQQSIYDTASQRITYEGSRPSHDGNRPYEHNHPQSRTYESNRSTYNDGPRSSYDHSRESYDTQRPFDNQRTSFGQPYETLPPSYQGQSQSPYPHYPESQSQHPPTHQHPQATSPPQPHHSDSQYLSQRFQHHAQYSHRDFIQQHQPPYGGNGGTNTYYDNSQSHTTVSHSGSPPQQTDYAPSHSTQNSSSWGMPCHITSAASYGYSAITPQPCAGPSGSSDFYPLSAPNTEPPSRAPPPGLSATYGRAQHLLTDPHPHTHAPPLNPYSSPPAPPSGPATGSHQEWLHLAPLRHVQGHPSSSPTPSSPGDGRYPALVPHSRHPFEQERPVGVNVAGKKSVLSIGSIISEGG